MITLPATAKYFSFVDKGNRYNSNYDITWSFTYSVTGSQATQHAYATFLTAHSSISSAPDSGHYLSTDTNDTSTPIQILKDDIITSKYPYNIITIAVDSTGYFALSDAALGRDGVGISSIIPYSLIIRSYDDSVICNQPLPASLTAIDSKNIIRCRYSNAASMLYIDYRHVDITEFSPLTSIALDFRIANESNKDILYPGISYGSPLMTTATDTNALILYNFISDGVFNDTEVEIITGGLLI